MKVENMPTQSPCDRCEASKHAPLCFKRVMICQGWSQLAVFNAYQKENSNLLLCCFSLSQYCAIGPTLWFAASPGIKIGYDKTGYVVYPIDPPTTYTQDKATIGFQTYTGKGTILTFVGPDGKHWDLLMVRFVAESISEHGSCSCVVQVHYKVFEWGVMTKYFTWIS